MRADIQQVYLEETQYKLRPHEIFPCFAVDPESVQFVESRTWKLVDILKPESLAQLELMRRRLCA
jgi:hypothetical protein